jgi:hypothetical protein
MKKNVGGADRTIRIVLGLAILGVGVYFKSWWGLIGLIPLLTGLFSYCGLYSLLGLSTCKSKTPAPAASSPAEAVAAKPPVQEPPKQA